MKRSLQLAKPTLQLAKTPFQFAKTPLQFAKKRLKHGLSAATLLTTAARWRFRARLPAPRPHGLREPLGISLTSYPPRFPTLLPTLQSLLLQSVRPDFVELWVAQTDVDQLPAAVRALQDHGLTINVCADTRSYKKIIPALAAHPDAIIVTADDDAYYWRTWLEELVAAYDPAVKEVLCHRGHGIVFREPGRPAPYRQWTLNTSDQTSSRAVFPTGLGGILYRPGIFIADVTRQDLFQTYCPTADDVWLFWMAALNGASFRKVGPIRRFILWSGGQEVALYNQNVLGDEANDRQIEAMLAAYGCPATREPA